MKPKKASILILLVCILSQKIHTMSTLLPVLNGVSGANIGKELGVKFHLSCMALASGFEKGTTFKFDPATREAFKEVANPNLTISPETFNSASRLIKQVGFTIGGAGIMLGGFYNFLLWTNRYFEKSTPTTYGDCAIGTISITASFAGAALMLGSVTNHKTLKTVQTKTGPKFAEIKVGRRNSVS